MHKRLLVACFVDSEGKVLKRADLALSRAALLEFAKKQLTQEDQVVLEATTNTWAVTRLLKPYVAKVTIANPLKTRLIAEAKVKTDKVDSEVLAQLLRMGYVAEVWQPDEKTSEMRSLTGRRAALTQGRTKVKNRIHALLAERLIEVPATVRLFGGTGLAWLKTVELDEAGRLSMDSELRLLDSYGKEIEAIDEVIARKGARDARIKLLVTLPGVGLNVAEALVAAWGDPARFKDADHAASYLGLTPRTYQSAAKCSHGPITKAGNHHARWMLVEAAHHLSKNPGPLGVFFRRLEAKRGYNVATVAGARKLAAIAWHMLKSNQPYRYAQPIPTSVKLADLRIRGTGERRTRGPIPDGLKPRRSSTEVTLERIKALQDVYKDEQLPEIQDAPPGEARALEQMNVAEYVLQIRKTRFVEKPKREGKRVNRTNRK